MEDNSVKAKKIKSIIKIIAVVVLVILLRKAIVALIALAVSCFIAYFIFNFIFSLFMNKNASQKVALAVTIVSFIIGCGSLVANGVGGMGIGGKSTIDKFFHSIEKNDVKNFFYSFTPKNKFEQSAYDYYDDNAEDGILDYLLGTTKYDFFEETEKKSLKDISTVNSTISNYLGENFKIQYKVIDVKKLDDNDIEEFWKFYDLYSLKYDDIKRGQTFTIEAKVKVKNKEPGKEVTFDMNLFYIEGDGWVIDGRVIQNDNFHELFRNAA